MVIIWVTAFLKYILIISSYKYYYIMVVNSLSHVVYDGMITQYDNTQQVIG